MKKLLAVCLTISLINLPITVNAAQFEGSKCSTIGKTKIVSKVSYQCSKAKIWKAVTKNSPAKGSTPAKKVIQTIVPVSIPTMPPMPAANSFAFNGSKWPADKTEYSVALFGEPGVVMDKSIRTLPIALQKLANATGNTFNILDVKNVAVPSIAAETTCSDSYSDVDVVVVGVSKWGKQPPDRTGDYHGVTSSRQIKKVLQCPYIKINTEASDWVQEDFSATGKSVGHTIMHEFGHAFGLSHPEECSQVMQSCAIFVNEFGAGDRYGLYQLTQGQR